jgi:trigger factor
VNIQFQKNQDLTANLTIQIKAEDYQQSWEQKLKKQQKNVSIKGFRPGKAPMGLVKSMYGTALLADEINNMTSKAINDYLKDNKIDILARPMESSSQSALDFDNPSDFELSFDLGIAPEVAINISDNDVVRRYNIVVSEEDINHEIEYLQERFGKLENKDVVESEDVIYANVSELNEAGEEFEGGVTAQNISFSLKSVEDKDVVKSFEGKKVEDTLVQNILSVYKNNDSVIASTLGIAKEAVADLNPSFRFTILEIKNFIPAELNETFFSEASGNPEVKTVEEFKIKIKENFEAYLKEEAEHLVDFEIEKLLDSKHSVELPDSFLKRWLMESNEGTYTQENIDEKYEKEANSLRSLLIREEIARVYDVKVETNDITDSAIAYSINLFRNYGIPNATPAMVSDFAKKQLQEQSFVQQMNEIALRRKVTLKVKELVTFQEESITKDEFYKKVNEQRGEVASA